MRAWCVHNWQADHVVTRDPDLLSLSLSFSFSISRALSPSHSMSPSFILACDRRETLSPIVGPEGWWCKEILSLVVFFFQHDAAVPCPPQRAALVTCPRRQFHDGRPKEIQGALKVDVHRQDCRSAPSVPSVSKFWPVLLQEPTPAGRD